MLRLYKYMPFDTLLKFLENPLLRITPSHCQNDPFEFGYTESDINALSRVGQNGDLGKNLKDFANLHGIVSLSATHNNILMWSHYADNHQGAVVEFLVDESRPLSMFINNTGIDGFQHESADYLFDKVKYSRKRGKNSMRRVRQQDELIAVRNHYYLTKANQWKYEKEYRFVLPFDWVNKIILNAEGYVKAKVLLGEYSERIQCIKGKFYINRGDIGVISTGNLELMKKLWQISDSNDIMFFSRINEGYPGHPRKIGCIFLGCNMNSENINKLTTKIKKHQFDCDTVHGFYSNKLSAEVQGILKGKMHRNEYKLQFETLDMSL